MSCGGVIFITIPLWYHVKGIQPTLNIKLFFSIKTRAILANMSATKAWKELHCEERGGLKKMIQKKDQCSEMAVSNISLNTCSSSRLIR
jgi:hypothetical protein